MMILVVFCAAIIIFSIMYFVPGDPAQLILGSGATAEQLAAKRIELGLDDSYWVRLGRFLNDVFLHFDLGTSYERGTSVMSEIIDRLPRTLLIGFLSVILGTVLGIPLGIMAARHQGKIRDQVSLWIAMIGFAVPGFWAALMLVILFSVKLHWLPGIGIGSWKHYILPVIAASLPGVGMVTRQMRSSMLETMRSDYVLSARAKGATERRVTYRHMVPNALMPVITVTGFMFAVVIAGSIIVEIVFTIPGIGLLLNNAIVHYDYPVIMGTVVFLSFMTSIVMLLTDLAYAFLDPRIKAQYRGTARI
jgi:peptide/nickel transport system permease protein